MAGGPGPGAGWALSSRGPLHQVGPVCKPTLTSPTVPVCQARPSTHLLPGGVRQDHCSDTRSPAFYSYEDSKHTRHLWTLCGPRHSRPGH